MSEEELIYKVVKNLETTIFEQLKVNTLRNNSRLKSYKVNPIVVKYLSRILEGSFTASGIAKALYLPRVLGTSINTTFGTNIQKMFVEVGLAKGSLIKGIDIEFIDHKDGLEKWCQLKSGPSTINSEDVAPLLKKFDTLVNLSRTNAVQINNNNLIVGVLYGDQNQLSQHYIKINKKHPVYAGADFWHRLTGHPNFYNRLCKELDKCIINFKPNNFFDAGLIKLTQEIEKCDLFGDLT